MAGWGSNKQLGRPGQPSEVAPSFVFLASKDATFYCMDLIPVLFKPRSRN